MSEYSDMSFGFPRIALRLTRHSLPCCAGGSSCCLLDPNPLMIFCDSSVMIRLERKSPRSFLSVKTLSTVWNANNVIQFLAKIIFCDTTTLRSARIISYLLTKITFVLLEKNWPHLVCESFPCKSGTTLELQLNCFKQSACFPQKTPLLKRTNNHVLTLHFGLFYVQINVFIL